MSTEAKLAKILVRVRLLLARADHPNTPPAEAELSRIRAEKLMFDYRIEQAQLQDTAEAVMKPSWREIVVCEMGNEFEKFYSQIAYFVVHHFDCEGVTTMQYIDGSPHRVVRVVGYEADLRFLDLLLTECLSAFGKHLEPKWDANQTLAQNAYRMRSGGMERNRIGLILFGASDTVNEMKAKNRKVTRLIKEEAASRGESADHLLGRNVNMKTYRQSFAVGFVSTLNTRLWNMRNSRGERGVVVLANRKQAIKEALYQEYPHLRPLPADRALGEGTKQKDCEKCKKAKTGYCRDHAFLRPRKVADRRWSYEASTRGADAARTVDLGSTGRGRLT